VSPWLSETQRAERVIAFDEPAYGFVRMAVWTLRDAGMVPPEMDETPAAAVVPCGANGGASGRRRHHRTLECLHASASSSALAAVGPRHNPFLTPLQNTLRKSAEFQAALHAFVKAEVCPALGVTRVAYQRRPTFRVHLVGFPVHVTDPRAIR